MKVAIHFEIDVPLRLAPAAHAKIRRVLTAHACRETEKFVQRCIATAFEAQEPGYWAAAKAQAARRQLRVVDPD